MTDVHLPVCPLCGEPPLWLLGGGTQAFCGNPGCRVMTWNPTITLEQFWADVVVSSPVDLLRAPGRTSDDR